MEIIERLMAICKMGPLETIMIICIAGAIITFAVNCILVLIFGMDHYDDSVIITMILPWVFIVAGFICVAIKMWII